MQKETTLDQVYSSVNRLFDHKYKLNNSYIYNWESDYFGIAKGSGYSYEVEIKMSRSDFKADFKKTNKHKSLVSRGRECLLKGSNKMSSMSIEYALSCGFKLDKFEKSRFDGKEYDKSHKVRKHTSTSILIQKLIIPNRFYYACPEGLIDASEIPNYAGLIYVSQYHAYTEKQALLLHKDKINLDRVLLDKFYYKYINKCNEIYDVKSALLLAQKQYELISEEEYNQLSLDI